MGFESHILLFFPAVCRSLLSENSFVRASDQEVSANILIGRKTLKLKFKSTLPAVVAIGLAPLLLSQATIASDPPASQKSIVVTDGSLKVDVGSATNVRVPNILPRVADGGTLKAGALTASCGHGSFTITGYNKTSSIGSYSPAVLTGGKTVIDVNDVTGGPCGTANSELAVSGFTANPGATWLTSITCNGVTRTGSTATFSYVSGTAAWIWSAHFGFVNGTTYSCSISHS